VRVVSSFANAVDNVIDLLLSRFLGHVDDHELGSPFMISR
jgi:hypothetical protein